MALKLPTRGGQWPITSEYVIDLAADTVTDINGVTAPFATAGTKVLDAIYLPTNAIILAAEVSTEIAVSGATTATLSLGDSTVIDRYLPATSVAAAGTIEGTPTGYINANGAELRATLVTEGTATAGKIVIRVTYIIRNRITETQTH